ncbi:AraC family transcriptional regulator [Sporosarcina pasteurii]|nr:AraC family transcriptional regulator [Sporosarcina pasteurii]MDS9472158.1 AraC family transcriptional regulator [Sporosarcina pasteurii]
MIYMTTEKQAKGTGDDRIEIGSVEETIAIEKFAEAEDQFLRDLFHLEKEKAKQTIRSLIDDVMGFSSDASRQQGLKYYFITLAGIIARQMKQLHIPVEKAFYFNSTCIKLIEDKLNEHNAADVADELIEFFIYSVEERNSPTLLHQTVNGVIQYIDEHIQSPMSVEGLAAKFDVSTSHLSRIFHEHSGITLVEYINIKKVEESQYYLSFSNQKISDISDDFNFCNQSYYTRIFKKYTGYTPRKFRENITRSYFKFTLPEEKQVEDKE